MIDLFFLSFRLRYDRMNFFVAGFMPDPDDFEPGFHNDLVSNKKTNFHFSFTVIVETGTTYSCATQKSNNYVKITVVHIKAGSIIRCLNMIQAIFKRTFDQSLLQK